jgi:hypothetical protein
MERRHLAGRYAGFQPACHLEGGVAAGWKPALPYHPRMPKRGSNLDAEIDPLFQLPLAEFTGARNALAARLKKQGRAVEAERVKALAKPPAPAWAVNQLYWQDPKSFETLLTVGERVRHAQTGKLRNVDLRALLDEKKRLMAALITRAGAILAPGGHAASADVMRRVSTTLESLAAWGERRDGVPKAGRLTVDLQPPGFDTLAELMGGKKLEPAKVLPFRSPKPVEDRAAAQARAREAVQAAEKALRAARREAEHAEAELTKVNARTAAVEKQKQEIEARYSDAKEQARAAASEVKKRAQAVADAERALAKARAAL